MEFIKKSIIFTAAAILIGAASSCSDYLDKTPEGKVPETQVDYASFDNMYQPVSGMYAKIRTSGMHWVIWEITTIRDQDVFSGQWNGSDYYNLSEYKYNDSFWGFDEIWKQYYNIIKCANSAIEALDNYGQHCTTDAQKATNKAYIGEVKFMRAYAYFRLVQAFGAVTILRDNNQTDLTRSTVDAVYKYALEDLEYGMTYMPRIRPNQSEHKGAVTAFSAATLAAKIYLNQGNYQKVKELTNDIIEHGNFQLYPDYYQLWKIPGKLCDESIFECQCTDFGNGSGDLIDPDAWFKCQGPNNSGSDISGWGDCGILKEFRDWAYNRGETVRATTSFLLAGEATPDGDYVRPQDNPSKTDCWNGKAYTPTCQLTPGRTKYGTNNNIRILRYADVLLMNAEAKIKLGESGDAPFNEVRRRAHMPELTNVTFDQVIDERRMELCCEWGERYNDLVRTGKAATELKGWSKEKALIPLPFNQTSTIPALSNEPKNE